MVHRVAVAGRKQRNACMGKHSGILLRMFIDRSIPLRVYNASQLPSRLEGMHRKTVRVGEVLTYQIMTENSITLQEMLDMGCNLKQALMLWGDPPSANNLIFKGLKKDGLEFLSRVLRDEVIQARFPAIQWFAVGLSIPDLYQLTPSVQTLKLWNITIPILMKHKAHDQGSVWQTRFNWKNEEWYELGFDREQYEATVRGDLSVSPDLRRTRLQWGPSR